MAASDTYVRARTDTSTKARAEDALEARGLLVSDAIRLLMLRIADERRLPFDVRVPNARTRKAMAELASGKGKRVPQRQGADGGPQCAGLSVPTRYGRPTSPTSRSGAGSCT